MNAESFKILTGVLALKEFTATSLAEAIGANTNTVSSWLQRRAAKGDYVVPAGRTEKGSNGRPAKVWCLREGAADRIRAELDGMGLAVRRQVSTEDEAQAAFDDDSVRITIRRHLLLASRTPDDETREEELAEARDWMEHEHERLAPWHEDGFACPEPVRREMAELEDWMRGLELRADRLWFEEFGRSVEFMADWMTAAIESWFQGTASSGAARFLPLALTGGSDLNRREALVRQLEIVLRTAEHVATIPVERLFGALLMTLARVQKGPAQDAVCDLLETVGYARLGRMLRVRMHNRQNTERERCFIQHVLMAFEVLPQLLQDETIGAWFDALPQSRFWSPTFINSYLTGLEHRPNAQVLRVAHEREDELEELRARLSGKDDPEWREQTKGLSLDPVDILAQIGKWMGLSAGWRSTSDYDLAFGWQQRFSMPG